MADNKDIKKEELINGAIQYENSLKTFFDSIPQKVFYKDLESRYVLCNKTYAEELKIKPEDIKGKTDYDFFQKKLSDKYRADDKRIMETGKQENFQEKYARNGEEIFVHTFKAPVFDKENRVIGVFGVFWDATSKVLEEEALKASELRYREIFEDSPISLWEEDLSEVKAYLEKLVSKGIKDIRAYFKEHPEELAHCVTMIKVIDVNNATLNLFKAKDRKDFWGGLSRVFVKESYADFMNEIIAISEGKKEVSFECVNQTLRGDKLHVRLKCSVAPGFEDTWLRVIISIVDITELVQTKNKLEALNKELTKSNKQMELLVVKDFHTGLYNRRYLDEIIETEFQRAKRYSYSLSTILLDLDYFRSINEVYGRQFGDLILKQFSKQLKNLMRRYDILVRMGGEEFAIISPRTDLESATTVAHRILDAINLYNFGNKTYSVKLKLTLVVCSYPEDNIARAMDLITFAGKMLAKGKDIGGNSVYTSADVKIKLTNGTMFKSAKDVNIEFLKKKIEKLDKRAKQSLTEAIYGFAKAIELKDAYTGDHVEKTVRYAVKIAEEIGLGKDDLERVEKAAILHDLGKIGISEKILHKKSKLSKKEYEAIEKHPQIAADIIRPVQHLHDIIPLILFHHENWDGKGYPRGLKGEETPIGARIIAVADAYQALTSNRPYRKAYKKAKAIAIIKQAAGKKYDPHIVSVLVKVLEKEE